ncbi:MAG: radical SAM protein [Selenomonadaceae bacterium]|nr:radical SAM protein [Selenomonadaceae bacterium]
MPMQLGGAIPLNVGAIGDAAILNTEQFAALYRQKLIDKIILPREHILGQQTLINYLQKLNVDLKDIYTTQRLNNHYLLGFFQPYTSAKYLPYLEFHIADHCNMNCKYCEHYSGLVKTPKFTNLERFTRDFEQLHKFIDDIGVIRILGGEPLLNPEVGEYVKLSRKLYPLTNIFVVTNAILLPKMPDEFFQTLRENNAGIHISFYPPLESKMPAIKKFLEEKQVSFYVADSPAKEFTIKQTLTRHNSKREVFLQCFQANCHNLYEGKIAACFLPFTTKYFNEYYDKNLPEDGALDLYEEGLTTEKLKKFLLTPFERCSYCTPPISAKWGTISHPSPITDWTNDHLR